MRERFARFRRSHEFWLLLVVLALGLVLTVSTDSFFTLQNLFDLLTSNAFIGVLCAGLLVVTSGGLVGKVTKVIDDDQVEVEVATDVRVRQMRSMVSGALPTITCIAAECSESTGSSEVS